MGCKIKKTKKLSTKNYCNCNCIYDNKNKFTTYIVEKYILDTQKCEAFIQMC